MIGEDSNLRPSAPNTPHRASTTLGFYAISNFLLGSAKFVMTNKAIFVRNLSEILSLFKFLEINLKLLNIKLLYFIFRNFFR